jgi:hypothetical protein
MEKIDVTMMDTETLEQTRKELIEEIESLPARFPVDGVEFTWREKTNTDFPEDGSGYPQAQTTISLNIGELSKYRDEYGYLSVKLDGSIRHYSFCSSSGENNVDAEKTIRQYNACCTLLSEEFRQGVIADYRAKAETLHSLEAAYKAVSAEQRRRRDEAENKGRAWLEAVGQVWYDYRSNLAERCVVQSSTEKTINFVTWVYDDTKKLWHIPLAMRVKRISKHLLGKKPNKNGSSKIMVCPTGSMDIQKQKPEYPETLAY